MDAKSINILVAENLTKQGSQKVVDTVVDVLVQKEVTRRADALTAALKLHDDARCNVVFQITHRSPDL